MIDAAVGSATQLHRKPRRRDRQARRRPRTATACARSSRAWCRPPRRWRTTTSSWKSGSTPPSRRSTSCRKISRSVRTESLTDPLTPLANRKFFDSHAGKGHRRRRANERTAVADDDRHRPFQDVQRHLRPSDRRPGAAPGRDVGEAERQGPGHRRALRRRGIRRHPAEHGAALGDHRRRPHPPRRDDQGTDEALDRRASRPRHDLDRRRHLAQGRHRADR